jgi:cap1 methyltransferase
VKLLLVQSLYAIMMQKKGGTFIIKFFDMFTYASMELLYLLKSFYKTVIVTKPKTSRYANSERYIVCRDFMMNSTLIFEPVFKKMIENIKDSDTNLVRILNVDIPYHFKLNLEQSNILLGKQQLTTINNTNQLIQAPKNDKITKFVKNNREKCVRWCIDNNIPYNKIKNENIFLKKTIKAIK